LSYLSPIPIGIADGMVYVLIASGLALTFGTMRLANMAHGGFFMLGAYLLYTISREWSSSLFAVIGGMILAIGGTTVLGLLAERVIYRRLYGRPQLSAMLGTFALMLAIQGGVGEVWGINPLSVNYPTIEGLSFVSLGGANIPIYSFVIIGASLVALAILGLILYKSRLGLHTRAIAMDRHMSSLLGIRTRRVFVLSFAIGCALAGLAGALAIPQLQLDPTLGADYIILGFALLLIGGLTSIRGALIAGLLVGIVEAYAATDFPYLAGYAVYIVVIVVLLVRPHGIFGAAHEEIELGS
jgi:branched-chain amino acid transport system permease protein